MTGPRTLREALDAFRAFLDERARRPRKSLGQNFLVDPNLLRAIVADAGIEKTDVVLEIGTGPGLLTLLLSREALRVVTVEKDPDVAAFARDLLSPLSNVELVEGDALLDKRHLSPRVRETLARALEDPDARSARFVANLPYSVATPVLLALLRELPEIPVLLAMVQRELGERLVAAPGCREYGPAAVIVHLLATGLLLRSVPPQVFWPRPKVESVILRLERRDRPLREVSPPFERFLLDVFSQRRKRLRTVVGRMVSGRGPGKARAVLEPWLECRAEELAPERLGELFDVISPLIS